MSEVGSTYNFSSFFEGGAAAAHGEKHMGAREEARDCLLRWARLFRELLCPLPSLFL